MWYFFKDPFDCFGEEVGQMMIVETEEEAGKNCDGQDER